MPRSALMNVMIQAAMKAGRSLSRDFTEVENLQVSIKGPGDFVSNADKKAEKTIYEALSKARPDYSFLMEERGEVKGKDSQHRWIVDPLDGTTNFLHGIPIFGVSIALESQGKLMAGVVYNPITDELYTAERGGGAFLNDRRIRVSARKDFRQSVIATGVPHVARGNHPRYIAQLQAVMRDCAGIRRCGACSIDLAWTAAGRFDAYWEENLSPWDMAAGLLIVREAGGFASDLDNKEKMLEKGALCVGNEHIQPQLLKILDGASIKAA